ncbi:hypothetical protein [Streptomyces umbrinus]|uniref:hypothetical protein n=1 Tax=Streptomyces umbrinus TaxID=67370 RepID=UPI0033E32C37
MASSPIPGSPSARSSRSARTPSRGQLSEIERRREQTAAERERQAEQRESAAVARERDAARRALLVGLGATGNDLDDAVLLLSRPPSSTLAPTPLSRPPRT